ASRSIVDQQAPSRGARHVTVRRGHHAIVPEGDGSTLANERHAGSVDAMLGDAHVPATQAVPPGVPMEYLLEGLPAQRLDPAWQSQTDSAVLRVVQRRGLDGMSRGHA